MSALSPDRRTHTPLHFSCSVSRVPHLFPVPGLLRLLLKSVPFLRLFLLAIDSLPPSEISVEVFKRVTKQGEQLIRENKQLIRGKN